MLFIALFANKQEIVRQFQVVQGASGNVVLKVVRGGDWSEQVFQDIVRRMRGYLRGAPLLVEFHQTIKPGASGKQRPIMLEADARANGASGITDP
jgi:hypothetical protein